MKIAGFQGDVVKLVTSSGSAAATYEYDAWGNVRSKSGTMADKNPLRYRGYYYDSETGFYYLQSRYYDPANYRFINADTYTSTDSTDAVAFNMFAYCANNPVTGLDPAGEWNWGGVLAGLGVILGTVITVATPVGALVAGAAITAGAVTTYAAATDSTMVICLILHKFLRMNMLKAAAQL